MMNEILIYIGSGMIILWGIARIIPLKAIIKDFGFISTDNRKIIAMESIAESLTLVFLGGLPMLITFLTDEWDQTARIVYLACAVMLVAMAVLTFFTGARTSSLWYKMCPAVKTIVAILFIQAGLL